MACSECGSRKGHKMSCETGNILAMKRQQPEVDLDALRPVPIAEIAQGPNRKWNEHAKAPELFERWWAKYGDESWSAKHAAHEGWYACAESLGVYDEEHQ